MNTAFILRTPTANLRISFDFTYLYLGLKEGVKTKKSGHLTALFYSFLSNNLLDGVLKLFVSYNLLCEHIGTGLR